MSIVLAILLVVSVICWWYRREWLEERDERMRCWHGWNHACNDNARIHNELQTERANFRDWREQHEKLKNQLDQLREILNVDRDGECGGTGETNEGGGAEEADISDHDWRKFGNPFENAGDFRAVLDTSAFQ